MQAGATDARLDALGAKIDDLARGIDQRFEQVDKKIDDFSQSIDRRFEQVDKRFDQLDRHFDKRLEQVDQHLDQVDRRLQGLESRFFYLQLTLTGSLFGVIAALLAAPQPVGLIHGSNGCAGLAKFRPPVRL